MCYEIFHICQYCKAHYNCTLPSNICPTVNGDRNKNMCDSCYERMEKIIAENELDVALISLEEIMRYEGD